MYQYDSVDGDAFDSLEKTLKSIEKNDDEEKECEISDTECEKNITECTEDTFSDFDEKFEITLSDFEDETDISSFIKLKEEEKKEIDDLDDMLKSHNLELGRKKAIEKENFINWEDISSHDFSHDFSHEKYEKYLDRMIETCSEYNIFRVLCESGVKNVNSYLLAKKMIEKDGECLKFLSNALKMNANLVLEAVGNNSRSFKYVPESLKKFRNILKQYLIHYDGTEYSPMRNTHLLDRTFCIEIVKQNGLALRFFESFNDDLHVVELAVKNNPESVSYVGEKLMKNKNIALEAVKNGYSNFHLLSEDLRSDIDIMEAILHINPSSILYFSSEFKNVPQLVMLSYRGDQKYKSIKLLEKLGYEEYRDESTLLKTYNEWISKKYVDIFRESDMIGNEHMIVEYYTYEIILRILYINPHLLNDPDFSQNIGMNKLLGRIFTKLLIFIVLEKYLQN
jgi:hypothetical protein